MSNDGELLFADCAQKAGARLVEIGCKVGKNMKPEDALSMYFGVRRRLIPNQPRKVFISKEIHVPSGHRACFDEILQKATAGADLLPYQSRRFLLRPHKDDALLSDWGVQHLHFDMGMNPKDRSSELLFARITDDAFYCIDVSDHQGFTRQIMLEILHSNWPESIARFRIRGIVGEKLTDEQIENLRHANCNTILAVQDGTPYGSIGGGYSSSGTNILDITQCARLRSLCRDVARRGIREADLCFAPLR